MKIAISHSGIKPRSGHASTQRVSVAIASEDHARAGLQELRRLLPSVHAEVLPRLESMAGRWHPAGYMVYALGVHDTFGSLRLHIWPRGVRRAEERPPGVRDVHDHVLHIVSLVVAGTYTDDLWEIWSESRGLSDEAIRSLGLFRVYKPSFGESGSDGLAATDDVVGARITGRRVVLAGDSHAIQAGLFHAPRISESDLCATLSFSSFPVLADGPRILMQGPRRDVVGMARPVEGIEARLAAAQVLGDVNASHDLDVR